MTSNAPGRWKTYSARRPRRRTPVSTLAEALEQAAILSEVTPEIAVVDRGYKGVDIEGVKIYHPGLRRGITRGLRAMTRRRSAIEPAIGYMKTDGKLDRNRLKGALGDAMHAVLCGAGHNLRMILRKLKAFYALTLAASLPPVRRMTPAGQNALFRGDY
jgi:IS5 family transposase